MKANYFISTIITSLAIPLSLMANSDPEISNIGVTDFSHIDNILYGSTSTDRGKAITVSNTGDIYIAGETWGSIDMNLAYFDSDYFYTKFTTVNGKLRGDTNQQGWEGIDYASSILVNADDEIFITGTLTGDLPGSPQLGNDTEIFNIGYLNSTFWVEQSGSSGTNPSTGTDRAKSSVMDSQGNIYIVGTTNGDFGTPVGTTGGSYDIFLLKMSRLGTTQWVKRFGSNEGDIALSLAVDMNDNIYITGYVGGTFNGLEIIGGFGGFISKFNSDGNLTTSIRVGNENSVTKAIAIDKENNLYVTGTNSGNPFLTKIDKNLVTLWTKDFSSTGTDNLGDGKNIAVDDKGNIFIIGGTFGDMDGNVNTNPVSGSSLTPGTSSDIFLMHYDTDGNKYETIQYGTIDGDSGNALAFDGKGVLYATGAMNNGNDTDVLLSKFAKTLSVTVTEGISDVIDIDATDIDLDIPGFSIKGIDSQLFTIDAATGIITFLSAPDINNPADDDADNIYEFDVVAEDNNGGADTVSMYVKVQPEDNMINLNPVYFLLL